jgi:dihydrosphingosine 1-phosphate phosphatase
MPTREYKKVPAHLKDDNVIPSVSELPSLITSIRHPRKRAVSIGPQSAADAYETLAYRDKRRRESITSMGALTPTRAPDGSGYFSPPASPVGSGPCAASTMSQAPSSGKLPSSKVGIYEQRMGNSAASTSPTGSTDHQNFDMASMTDGVNDHEEEREEREMFLRLEKPRVRYDVEVVTKLIVYSGMQPFFFPLTLPHSPFDPLRSGSLQKYTARRYRLDCSRSKPDFVRDIRSRHGEAIRINLPN